MPQINFGAREIRCKLVYWGPGLSGKTTNLQVVHTKAPPARRGELVAIATTGDRTLFFDYLPLDLGDVNGMRVRFQLYTVPGQAYYRATRKLVLQGADGVVFVADSQPAMREQNRLALEDLDETLAEHGLDRARVPVVFQWNKRDMPGALPLDELDRELNPRGAPSFEAVAAKGEGVFPTLRCAAGLVLEQLRRDFGIEPAPTPTPRPRPASPSSPHGVGGSRKGPVAPRPTRRAPAPPPAAREPAREEPPPALPPGRHAAGLVTAAPEPTPAPRPRRGSRLRLALLLALAGLAGLAWLGQAGRLPAPLQALWSRCLSGS